MEAYQLKVTKLTRLYNRIQSCLHHGLVGPTLQAEIAAFQEVVDDLTEQEAQPVKPHYEQLLRDAYNRMIALMAEEARRKEAALRPPPPPPQPTNPVSGPKGAEEDKLPRDPVPSWNGKIETFFAFWAMFNKRVLENESISDGARVNRLYTALPEHIRDAVLGMNLKEATTWLKEKFQCEDAVAEFVETELGKIESIKTPSPESLKLLVDFLERATRVIASIDDLPDSVGVDLFKKAYSKLPEGMRAKFMDSVERKNRSAANLCSFLVKQRQNLIADRMTFVGVPVAGENACRVCKETGHLTRDCPVKLATVCFKCDQKGHLAKFCPQSKSSNKDNSSAYACANVSVQVKDQPVVPPGKEQSRCCYCKQVGHLIRQCPKKLAMKCRRCDEMGHIAKFCHNLVPPTEAMLCERSDSAYKWTFDAEIESKEVEILVDTGSDKSHLPVDQFPVDEEDKAKSQAFGCADKSSSFVAYGPVSKTMKVDDTNLEFDAYIGNQIGRAHV